MTRIFSILIFVLTLGLTSASAADIRFATDWKAQAEHGGFYQAVAKGYYSDEGLSVTLLPGGPHVNLPLLVAAGQLDLAMASNSFQPYNLLASGADVKVVMASFQKDPQVLMVHPDDPAQSLSDLTGKPIFIGDAAKVTFWPWLKARFGYNDTQIRKYNYSLAPWLVNPGTAQEGYLSSEPYTAATAGKTPRVFLFSDAGYPGYAGMVMVRGAYLDANRDTVAAFVRASIKGWQDYIWGDPSAADALILRDNPEMTADLLAYAREAMRQNKMLGSPEAVGQMDPVRWEQFYKEMADLEVLERGLDADAVYDLSVLP